MALRHNNKRRRFFFVSHELGKHLAIAPDTLWRATRQLIDLYGEARGWPGSKPPGPTLVIGFAETATAMGHCLFDQLEGDVAFLHSTRTVLPGWESLLFAEESHSHAPEQYFYLNDPGLLDQAEEILIVDDELTTGNTAAKLVRSIEAVAPGKRFGLLTFLDWQGPTGAISKLRQDGIDIQSVALLSGDIELDWPLSELPAAQFAEGNGELGHWHEHNIKLQSRPQHAPYLLGTGRFGVTRAEHEETLTLLAQAFGPLQKARRGRRTLCLGTGEFMYLPLVATRAMGDGAVFHATSRSPALPIDHPGYAIRSGVRFESIDNPARTDYCYNLAGGQYDEVFVFVEETIGQNIEPMLRALNFTGIEHKHVVRLGALA